MTPEQEILEDALAAAKQRIGRFVEELVEHGSVLPLDPKADWSDPSASVQTHMSAFTKRYEMTQDLISRRLFRSILAVRGTKLRTNALAEVVALVDQLGLIPDPARWEEITKLRNGFAHDYAMSFSTMVPMYNQAWTFAPDLVAMVARVERYVADYDLLKEGEEG